MELPIIGQVENPEDLDLEPVVVPLAAYTLDREEVIERFPFKPTMPAGALSAFIRNAGPNGELPINVTLACLERCLIADAVERWQTFLDRDDLVIETNTLGQVFNALVEHYGARPTRPRSGSPSTGSPAKRTSRAGARSATSRSKTSRSR